MKRSEAIDGLVAAARRDGNNVELAEALAALDTSIPD